MKCQSIFSFMVTLTGLYFACIVSASAQGVSASEILLGQTGPLSGPLAELGKESVAGSKAYFDHINAHGGVNGRKIRLITLDDGYDTDRAILNVRQLIEKEKVFALFGVIGTQVNIALIPLIERVGIPSFAPVSGADAVRIPFRRLVFVTSASYADELDKIVEHLSTRGIQKICAIYLNNAMGKEGLANLERSLVARNLKLSGSVSIESTGADAEKASVAMASDPPQAIILITSGRASFEFIKSYNQHKQALGTQYFGLSVIGSQQAIQALGADDAGVVVSQISPFPFSATSSIVREYQKVMAEQGIKHLSFASIGGYINAKLIVDGMRRAGRDLTRENVMRTLEAMRETDYGGYIVNYTGTNHLGSRYVELTVISKDGKFQR